MSQRLADAREQANQILQLEPAHPAALKLKGNIQYLLGEFENAQDTFISILDAHPDDDEAAYMLGRIYYQEGHIDQAAGQFQRALKINPKSYKAYDNLGLCYEAQGEKEMATRYFLTAIKLVDKDHPDYDWPYANLANLLVENGDAEKAFAAASKAADRNPYSARNFYIGGKALCKLQKTDLCVNWLERSVSLDLNYAEPLYLLSKAYAQLGQKEKAEQALNKFREVKSRTPSKKR
jgi:Flp pilus assembly protein TadD